MGDEPIAVDARPPLAVPPLSMRLHLYPDDDPFDCFGYLEGDHVFVADSGGRSLRVHLSRVVPGSVEQPARLLADLRTGQYVWYLDKNGKGRLGTVTGVVPGGVTLSSQCGTEVRVPLGYLRIPTSFHMRQDPTIHWPREIEYAFSFGTTWIDGKKPHTGCVGAPDEGGGAPDRAGRDGVALLGGVDRGERVRAPGGPAGAEPQREVVAPLGGPPGGAVGPPVPAPVQPGGGRARAARGVPGRGLPEPGAPPAVPPAGVRRGAAPGPLGIGVREEARRHPQAQEGVAVLGPGPREADTHLHHTPPDTTS